MSTLAIVTFLLVLTVVCVAAGERLKLPYPILMLIASTAFACIPGLESWHLEIETDLILPLFLPPLLFATAQHSSWSVFRTRWKTLLFLAVGLTAVTAFAVAGTVWLLVPGIAVPLALMVGAMVAPPDPVAVEAVAGPAKMPRRLLSTLQTEGLFNDAVAIVLYSAALTALTTESGKLGFGLLVDFVLGAVMAVGIEEVHASGVIAVVVTALETKRKSQVSDAEARLSRSTFWDVANVLVTGLAFGLMGTQLRDVVVSERSDVLGYIPIAATVCGVVIVIRIVAMFLLRFVEHSADGPDLGWKDSVTLTWCGMRGLATLALALAIPTVDAAGDAIEYRNMLIIVACSVILVTLVPTGLLVGGFVRLLGLQDDGSTTRLEVQELTERAKTAALEAIDERFGASDELSDQQKKALRDRFVGLRRRLDTTTQAMTALNPDGTPVDTATHEAQLKKVQTLRRGRELMVAAQTVGLDAARAEVISARSESGVDPHAVDIVLRQLDLQMLAAPPRTRRASQAH
jgi:CPA1 family monovalent cation:H+ antiporter